MPRIRSMIEHVPGVGLAQFLLGSNHMEFDKDNSHLLQLIFEMRKKLQTSELEFGLNSKAF